MVFRPQQLAAARLPARIVTNASKQLQKLIRYIEDLPVHAHGDEALTGKAREAVHALIGNAIILEKAGHVYAQTEMGRACITAGAQERT